MEVFCILPTERRPWGKPSIHIWIPQEELDDVAREKDVRVTLFFFLAATET